MGRCKIEDHRNARTMSLRDKSLHGSWRDFHLEYQGLCLTESGEDFGKTYLVQSYPHICSRGNDNRVIAIGCEKNECNTTCFLCISKDKLCIDMISLQCLNEPHSKGIGSHAPGHTHLCPQAGHRYCLIRSFPSGYKLERTCS